MPSKPAPAPQQTPAAPVVSGRSIGPPSCRTCLHRRTVVTLFDTGQMREMMDCAFLVWPAPVQPDSFYRKEKQIYTDRAAKCPHYKYGRRADLVKTEQSQSE